MEFDMKVSQQVQVQKKVSFQAHNFMAKESYLNNSYYMDVAICVNFSQGCRYKFITSFKGVIWSNYLGYFFFSSKEL